MRRMQYWDVAKGITILLVIMGHLPQTPAWLTQAIYTFHMPFFFIANAFFIKHYDVKIHAKKNFKSLLVPYMVVCVLEAICYALRGNTDVYYTYDILRVNGEVISGQDMSFGRIFLDKIADMFAGISFTSSSFKAFESVWIVWFLAVLFVSKMLYVSMMQTISKGCTKVMVKTMGKEAYDKKQSQVIYAAVSFIIMFVLAFVGMRIGQNIAFLPWSVDVALACLPFMWMGDYLGKKKVFEHKKANLLYVVSFILWIVLTGLGYRGELALRIYIGDFVWMINAVFGSIVMVGLAKLLSHKQNLIADFFAWCGKNSIVILGIHCLEHRFFDWNRFVYDWIAVELHWFVLYFIHAIAIVCSAWIVVECKRRVGILIEKKAGYANV